MADLPIPFTAPMILALLAKRKTMTRRVLTWLRKKGPVTEFGRSTTPGYHWHFRDSQKRWHDVRHDRMLQLLPWQVGDRLWVRETYYQFGHWEEMPGRRTKQGRMKWRFVAADPEIRFDAPDDYRKGRHHKDPHTPAWHKRLGRFMPRAASRLTLIVESVKIERLQDIGKEDAISEGCDLTTEQREENERLRNRKPSGWALRTPEGNFLRLWCAIHGGIDAWDANPWVVAITFRVVKANIDKLDISNHPLVCEEVTP